MKTQVFMQYCVNSILSYPISVVEYWLEYLAFRKLHSYDVTTH